MSEAVSHPFRATVAAFAGVTGPGFDSLLSSLPSELAFNDLRDAGRRHSKFEKVNPSNLHAVCVKSASKRCCGAQLLQLEESDWESHFKGKTVRARVHQALRMKDVDLGVNCEGLTRHKNNKAYTKPHVFCDRLRLLQVLQKIWDAAAGDFEQKSDAVLAAYKAMFASKIVPCHCFLRWKQEPVSDTRRFMVLSAGPYALRVLPLEVVPDSNPVGFTFKDKKPPRGLEVVGELMEVEMAFTEPALSADQKLMWIQTSGFMSLPQYVADYNILETASSLLSSICSALKMKGHTKLSHKKRVEAFLQHMEKDAAYISSILEEIPEHEPRRPRAHPEPAPSARIETTSAGFYSIRNRHWN